MYYYLKNYSTKIEEKDYIVVVIGYTGDSDGINRIYCPKNDNLVNQLSYLQRFDDVTSYIGSKVKSDGHVALTFNI